MKTLIPTALILAAAATFVCTGCASNGNGDGSSAGATTAPKNSHAKTWDALPPGHAFAKLSYGMGEREVSDTIGEPNDRSGYVTGQAWNPFYYGTDTNRQTWYYKGQGRLTFNSRGRLIEVHANADERGYR